MINDNLSLSPRGAGATSPPDTGEISLREVFDLLWAARSTILKITGGVFLLTVCFCMVYPPLFRSDGVLQIDSPAKGTEAATGPANASLAGTPVLTAGEVQILRSRLVLDAVVAKLNLSVATRPNFFPIVGYPIARLLDDPSDPPGDAPSGAPWGLRRWSWGGDQLSVASMEVPFNQLNDTLTLRATSEGFALYSGGTLLLRGKAGEPAASPDGRFRILVGTLRAHPGTEFCVTKYSHEDTLNSVLENLNVRELASGSGVIGVSYAAASRQLAMDFVNALQAAYLEQNANRYSLKAQQSKSVQEKRLAQIRDQLAAAQKELSDYQETHGVPNVPGETQILLKSSVDLDTKRLEIRTALDQAQQQFGPESSQIKTLRQQLASVESEQSRLDERIAALPPMQQKVVALTRDVKVFTKLYNSTLTAIQNYEMLESGPISNVRVVDQASEPFKPYFPRPRLLLLLSLPLGFLAGAMWVFAQRAMLRGIDNPSQLEQRTHLVTYASIPYSKRQHRLNRGSAPATQILAVSAPDDPAIEVLREMCAFPQPESSGAMSHALMLCGPTPDVGTTFLTVNLGTVLARSGARVVVVDADLHRGAVHSYFNATASPGLSDFLSGASPPETFIRHSEVAGLEYVPCGARASRPTDLLRRPRFADLMNYLLGQYDYVLVAAPPVLAVPDATLIGQFAGHTLLVLRAAHHPCNAIEAAIGRLVAAGLEVRGALLNRVGERAGSYLYRDYGYGRFQYSNSG